MARIGTVIACVYVFALGLASAGCATWVNQLNSTACMCFDLDEARAEVTGFYTSAVGQTKGVPYPLYGAAIVTEDNYARMMSWSVAWIQSATAWSGVMPMPDSYHVQLIGKDIYTTWTLTVPGALWSNTLVGKDHFTLQHLNDTCN